MTVQQVRLIRWLACVPQFTQWRLKLRTLLASLGPRILSLDGLPKQRRRPPQKTPPPCQPAETALLAFLLRRPGSFPRQPLGLESLRLETSPSRPMPQAARKRSGPISPISNGLTKMPSGRPRNRRSRFAFRIESGSDLKSSPSIKIGAAHILARNAFRNILRPTFGGVEGGDADRIVVLAGY